MLVSLVDGTKINVGLADGDGRRKKKWRWGLVMVDGLFFLMLSL